MIYDVFSRLFLAVLVVAYLGFLAALAWWAMRGRLRLKDRLVPAFNSGLEGFRTSLQRQGAENRVRERREAPRAPCETPLILERGALCADSAKRKSPAFRS